MRCAALVCDAMCRRCVDSVVFSFVFHNARFDANLIVCAILANRSMSFLPGVIRSNTTRNNIMVLNNTSEVALMYHIQKTGSVASGLFFSEGLAGTHKRNRKKVLYP